MPCAAASRMSSFCRSCAVLFTLYLFFFARFTCLWKPLKSFYGALFDDRGDQVLPGGVPRLRIWTAETPCALRCGREKSKNKSAASADLVSTLFVSLIHDWPDDRAIRSGGLPLARPQGRRIKTATGYGQICIVSLVLRARESS
ncbi:hypothetical protein BC827DRAFT_429800 [Russula dissimulans]|nr:hypothetical protein BC827DRAFT_429800 [Russula dissimulans]